MSISTKKSSETKILEKIFKGVTEEQFLSEYWPEKPLVTHDNLESFNSIPGFNKVQSLEDVLSIYQNPVMVYGDVVVEETEGISDRILVRPDQVMDWYNKGAAVELDFTDLFIPQIRKWTEKLKEELKLPTGTATKAIVYAAKNGGGFKAHFDAYTNFIFQIKGEKLWKLEANENAKYPVQHFDLAEAPYYPAELQSYWEGEPPSEDLPNAEIVNLKPGSVLYLPRGVWHSTRSDNETLALNLTFGQPTWVDLYLAALRKKMVSNEKFRALASNINLLSDKEKENTNNNLKELAKDLIQILEDINPSDITDSQNWDFDQYQSTQLIFRQLLTNYRD